MSTISIAGASRPVHRMAPALERAPHRARLRLTARGRAVLLALLAIPLALGIGLGVMNGGGADATNGAPATLQYVTVESGQTLWGLAKQIAPNADPRDVVAELMQLNQLPSGAVPAGLHLAIPPKYTN